MDCVKLIFDIITAIGSLATFGAFIFLFRRDKDKQTQIDKLTGIVTSLEDQNDILKKHNDLIAQQVDIFRNTSLLNGNDPSAIRRLTELEERKQKLNYQPFLFLKGSSSIGHSGEFEITIGNKGEEATLTNIDLKSDDVCLSKLDLPYKLEKSSSIRIKGCSKGSIHINGCKYVIYVTFLDRLRNKYQSKIEGTGSVTKFLETIEL